MPFQSYATQVPPFRFRYTGDSKPKTVDRAQHRANVMVSKQRKKIEWEKKKEIQRLENPITYEIIPASTPGFVHLHRVAATRGVITSDTWETVPEDDLKVDLYRVRMADNPSPPTNSSPLTCLAASSNKKSDTSSEKRDVPLENNGAISTGSLTSNQLFLPSPNVSPDDDAMDVDAE